MGCKNLFSRLPWVCLSPTLPPPEGRGIASAPTSFSVVTFALMGKSTEHTCKEPRQFRCLCGSFKTGRIHQYRYVAPMLFVYLFGMLEERFAVRDGIVNVRESQIVMQHLVQENISEVLLTPVKVAGNLNPRLFQPAPAHGLLAREPPAIAIRPHQPYLRQRKDVVEHVLIVLSEPLGDIFYAYFHRQ